ncbi:DUF6452 family protein [Flavobacterium capsici]|uniref:DUF6452 family protein n=1 Tax=Flavobacterium capsici TaxID=3075618 RepID=A0AA96J7C3_9FLAO|nr:MULTISPECIES: DUF6452 family protein [unclassified Flavobacterium]WNM18134.1 DUF6452 family protein [Flavobacterium sp. PMR2A8]WNM22186.1 DUF6452 family protein [Flavobacterium sp. PMTSA4]
MKKIILLLLLAVSFSSCEKDDICADDTTPKLIIEFFDTNNPSVNKNIVGLKVTAEGETIEYNTFSSVSKIAIPLRIDGTTTKYSFILNSSDVDNLNEDFLEFNYTTQNVYVSRACGYKTIFELNNDASGVINTDATTPDGIWMQDIVTETNSITNENETHIKIYF